MPEFNKAEQGAHAPMHGSASKRDLSRDELTALVGLVCDWAWETDADLRFSWLSDNYADVTGIEIAAVIGRFRFDFLRHASRANGSVISHLEDLEARRPFRDFIYELQGAKPGCSWISTTGWPRFAADGTFLGYRGIVRNITDSASVDETGAAAPPDKQQSSAKPAGENQAERMMAALNEMSDAFSYYDSEDRLVLFNQAMLDMYGGMADRIRPGVTYAHLLDVGIERNLFDMGDADGPTWHAQTMARRRAPHWQHTVRTADDRWIMHREMRTEDGGVIGISTDVTEIKSGEAALAELSEQRGQLLFDLDRTIDAMRMGVVLLDADLKAEIINQAFYDIWKVSKADVDVGSPFRALMDVNRHNGIYAVEDDEWEAYVTHRLGEIRAGSVAPREFVRADGCTMIYSVTALSGGKRLVTYYDITDMKRRETELGGALERARLADAVINGVKDPIFVKDDDLRFVFVNEAFAAMFDTTPGKMLGMSGSDFVGSSDAAFFEESERQVLETGVSYEVEENFDFTGIGRSRIVRKNKVSIDGGRDYVACFIFDITELKRRETEAEEARRHLANVLESLPAGVIIYDRDDRFVLANRTLQESLPALKPAWQPGFTFREAIELGHSLGYFRNSGDPALDTLYDNDRTAWIEGYMARHDRRHAIYERRNPDGRWYQVYDTRTEDGTFIGVRVDITELKEREKALRDSMRQTDLLHHAMDELPVAAFIKSGDMTIEFVNKAWCALTGLAKEDAIGKTDIELFRAADALGYTACDQTVLASGEVVETEEDLGHTDGSVRRVVARKSRMVAIDGTVHLVGSSTDITEVKAREEKLRETLRDNEVFQSLIDNLPVAIYAKKPDLRLTYVNKGWCELTGFGKEQAIGKTDVDIFGADGEAFAEGDLAVLHSGAMHEIDETVTLPDGSIRYQFARKGSLIASDGSLYLIGSTFDVTEQKQREKELREAQHRAVLADRAKSEFLANMSHEIRTPMNGVLGMAELLAKSELDPKQRTFTDIIVKSGNALLTIINDILDFSKIDAGQLVLDPAPFNLAEAVEDVATLVSTRAKEKDLELIVRVAPGLQDLYVGDVGRIRQIITNLLGNAVKFTESGHVLVDVSGERSGAVTNLRIAVTDTGIGIPAEKLQLVFEKFSQVDGSSTRRHEGTGLGLAITSRLVALMGGEIGVESAEGQGSTFWFTLSLPHTARSVERRATPVDVTGARILVVDDNAVNRAILKEQMASWTFDACAAESGEEGLKVLRAAAGFGIPVDCVVLDYQMPGMTGAEMARIMRMTPGIADTPVVMLTSVDQSLSNVNYRDLAINAQLIKPARSSALLEALVLTIQKHRESAHPHIDADVAQQQLHHAKAPPRPTIATVTPQPASPAPIVDATPSSGHRIDILVAEDNEVNQLVFTQILGETKLTFQIVGNGRRAVETYKEMNPRLVLMDVSMPEMNGLEATAEIRAFEAGTGLHVPIVGVTAHALKGDRERCLEAGMDDYLPKPISPRALLEKVDRWAAQQTGRRDIA